MNARMMTRLAVAVLGGWIAVGGQASAQEAGGPGRSDAENCYRVMGEARDTWPGTGNVSTGVLVGARLLNGTTQYVYDTASFPTPDPNVVTFGAALTLTTRRGVVSARVLFLFDVVTGTWTSMATIDPNASTGHFAGATGTLWFPFGTAVSHDDGSQSYPSDVTGRLCLGR